MYLPPAFAEPDLDRQHQLIRQCPLGLLISSAGGLQASPLPFHLEIDGSPFGSLQVHLSRGNPQWRALDGQEVLVIFQGLDSYVSPSWYPAKAEHGKVVPTWNYVVVEARGVARVIEDEDWLRRQIARLTANHEQSRDHPWHVTDAPPEFIDSQIRGIIGVEIPIGRIDGKWKLNQNRSVADREGVAAGLEESGDKPMAALVRERIPTEP